MENKYYIGIDVGSTTAKIIVTDKNGQICHSEYRRHFSDTKTTVMCLLNEFAALNPGSYGAFFFTGSGGMGIAKAINAGFVQEVISVTTALKRLDRTVDVAIELGGEDAKIIYLTNGMEQRMNGICAGGTGSFIDQMAALLQTDASGLDDLAENAKMVYPIAARCGVFAKTDIQPLINDGAAREDLAASVFQAVVNQTISGLACGRPIRGNVAFLGGPLHYLKNLRKAFKETLKLSDETAISPENSHLFAALGASIYAQHNATEFFDVQSFAEKLANDTKITAEISRLDPLFETKEDYDAFISRQNSYCVKKADLKTYSGNCFMGVDAGSTTTKIAVISENGELLYSFYANNQGDPIKTAQNAFSEIKSLMPITANLVYACSTGYGENLMQDAFCLNEGEVETIAHFYAARFFEPEVDCILDIGGQDMKCIKIKDGYVDTILLNEACSSGCGSFIENFANSMNYTAQEFAQKALFSKTPLDLGTRCTVFMNSNVKQAQKEGADVSDIAAGLAYSVIKNALFKVIKLTNSESLGKKIVAQGGTFYNDAVLRSFEKVSGTFAIRPDIAGIMGAFGAALIAKERYCADLAKPLNLEEMISVHYDTSVTHCKGCENRCRLTVNRFSGGRTHISGNRCEKGLGSKSSSNDAPNLFEYKKKRTFDYAPLDKNDAPRGVIGIPRVLNLYEDYPFWAIFFKKLGFSVKISPFSDRNIFSLGMESIPSESECYPAKIAHGHIQWLIDSGVKTIFYPCVFYERQEDKTAQNHFNCPMVMSYPENIKNNMESLNENNVRFLHPFIAFTNEKILTDALCKFFAEEFNISKGEIKSACHAGWEELLKFRADVEKAGDEAILWMKNNNRRGIVLAGRPYHLDPEINHGIPEMLHSYGVAVLTEDCVSHLAETKILRVTNQWMYHSRLYRCAEYVCQNPLLDMIQLNSFGCGLDAVTADQVAEILYKSGKMYTLLKIDEVNNLGAARIRVRSMLAALRMRESLTFPSYENKDFTYIEFTEQMKNDGYTILCPPMSPIHFDFLEAAFRESGYRIEMMRTEGQKVIDLGLQYVNNDACYPALIVIGQMMEAVLSGRYDVHKLAFIMSQTGGGCRASNYVSLIRRALNMAGYGFIPVLSLNFTGLEKHSGLKVTPKLVVKTAHAVAYGDTLMKVLYRMRPYEKEAGSANSLYEKWKQICIADISSSAYGFKKFKQNIFGMIEDFDNLPIYDNVSKPKVGIVGEILVKYMPFANNHLVDLLESEGAQAVVPSLVGFLEYCCENAIYRAKNLGKSKVTSFFNNVAEKVITLFLTSVNEALGKSVHFEPDHSIKEIQKNASEVVSIGNQCGEGWYLAGEIVTMIKHGINNIVCTQPFGCLPNHIVGKGIIKKIKEICQNANIVAVDYDPSASKVNQLNRIKLMLENASGGIFADIVPQKTEDLSKTTALV